MKSKKLVEDLKYARDHSYALGAFNIFNYLSAKAVIDAAVKLDTPVMLQTSVSTVKQFGVEELGSMLRDLADRAPVNVYIHLDHCTDLDLARACVDAGWDSIMYDGSALPVEENIKNCKEIIPYAHEHGVFVEGELGTIGGVEDNVSVNEEDVVGAKFDESLRFVEETGVDLLAPAIGTAHGIYKGTPHINFELVEELKTAIDTPVVIHGGSGLSEDTFRRLVRGGGCKVNISTAIKHAYLDNSKKYWEEFPDKVNPLHFDEYLSQKIEEVALEHLMFFRKDMV